MKNKIVVWGTNAQQEKVLIGLELQPETNKVLLHTFPESIATEEFVNKMMAEWRNGAPVPFPEGYSTLERELSVVESILPDDLKVDRPDLIQRAQTEWQFAVLSAKLHQAYQQELAEFREKVKALENYDHTLWDDLRSFWDKVQGQSRDRNLFREHADNLRDNINELFDDLKKLRARVQDEFMVTSKKIFEEFNTTLDDVEKRIVAGGNKLNSVFEDLKQLQRKYRDARMSNEHRNSLWERLDGAFKAAKERKFGPAANEGSVMERHGRRLEGLNDAIRRMEDSIKRDEDELTFQRKKVDATEGQLEAQIRTAKIKMIDERIGSKREKLNEMLHTRLEVERQINITKEKEARRAEKESEKQRIDAAKEAAKSEIQASIKSKKPAPATETIASLTGDALAGAVPTSDASQAVEADLETAATAEANHQAAEADVPQAQSEKSEESLLGAIGTMISEAVEDASTTARAIFQVASEDPKGFVTEVVEKAQEVYEKAVEKVTDFVEEVKSSGNDTAESSTTTSDTTSSHEEAEITPVVVEETPVAVAPEPGEENTTVLEMETKPAEAEENNLTAVESESAAVDAGENAEKKD